ncbi:hypothetical protein CB1_000287014 [Camelus ferus]|nr:hypothetical protein CB1_000287014 [Camelus ferus]
MCTGCYEKTEYPPWKPQRPESVQREPGCHARRALPVLRKRNRHLLWGQNSEITTVNNSQYDEDEFCPKRVEIRSQPAPREKALQVEGGLGGTPVAPDKADNSVLKPSLVTSKPCLWPVPWPSLPALPATRHHQCFCQASGSTEGAPSTSSEVALWFLAHEQRPPRCAGLSWDCFLLPPHCTVWTSESTDGKQHVLTGQCSVLRVSDPEASHTRGRPPPPQPPRCLCLTPLAPHDAFSVSPCGRAGRASFKGPKDGVSGRQQEVLEKLGSEAKDALESLAALASLTQGFPGADHPEGNRRPGVPSFGPVGSDRSGFPDPQHLCRCD